MTTRTISPGATLDFVFPWGSWLADLETISTRTVTASGATVNSSSITEASESVQVWLTFPTTPGARGWVDCQITTNQGRTDTRRLEFVVGPQLL